MPSSIIKSLGEVTASTLLVLGALFPIVNPVGNAPVFLALTRGLSDGARAKLARSVALDSLALIFVSIFIGTHILGFFGISLPVVQVGGGLVVISTGWTLLRRVDDEAGENVTNTCKEENYMKNAFYPLTLPLTVGPGSISVAITVGANRRPGAEWHWPLITGLLIGTAAITLSIYLSYRFAERIAAVLGDAAMNVMLRLSSFILVCIGVQITWNGVSTLLRTVVR